MKEIIYYTDNQLDEKIMSTVQKYLFKSELPIVSSSLKKIPFGANKTMKEKRGYVTMIKQIICCLKRSKGKYVFFCEHDVLYPKSHFDFNPPKDDVYYYNKNCWRWFYGDDKAVRYSRMYSLSGMCCNRELALKHYKARMADMVNREQDKDDRTSPAWARKRGFEPGTKPKDKGGFSDEEFDTWESVEPLIDIRHKGTLSKACTSKEDFNHEPEWWKEIPIKEIKGWNLEALFN